MDINNPANKAKVTYYARLVKKEIWSIDDVPEEYRAAVIERIKELPDSLKPETPEVAEQESVDEDN